MGEVGVLMINNRGIMLSMESLLKHIPFKGSIPLPLVCFSVNNDPQLTNHYS